MANSVTARFNDDCKVFVSMSDDTTVEKAVIIDAEGNETDIGGGGGENDFSTAEVTFICNVDDDFEINIATAEDAAPPYVPAAYANPIIPLGGGSEGTYSVILYKGLSLGFITTTNETFTVEVTGDITYKVGPKTLEITGPGTVTIKPGEY